MARYQIKSVELAKNISLSENAVSNLRASKSMPRIDGERLNSLCMGLTRLCHERGEVVTIDPSDLIEFSLDENF